MILTQKNTLVLALVEGNEDDSVTPGRGEHID